MGDVRYFAEHAGKPADDTITGTPLSVGGGVRMATSEGDITLLAANIVAEQDVGIHAAGDLSIRSGQDTLGNANASQSKAIKNPIQSALSQRDATLAT